MRSYIVDQLIWYAQIYPDAGWEKDSDALDGNMALSSGRKSSKTPSAQGKETLPTKDSVVPMIPRRSIIDKMEEIKTQSPELYDLAVFLYSGKADEVKKYLKDAERAGEIVVQLLEKKGL